MDTPVSSVRGERRRKDRVTLQIILAFTLTCPKTFTQDRVSVNRWIYMPYIWLLTLTCITLVQTSVRRVLEKSPNPCWVSAQVYRCKTGRREIL
jgi:hypothetical protein